MTSILRWLSDVGQDILDRIINILICIDQLAFSVLTLGSSAPDETLSAAAYRLEQQGGWPGKLFRPVIDLLFRPFQKHHCYLAYLAESRGYQQHHDYKEPL